MARGYYVRSTRGFHGYFALSTDPSQYLRPSGSPKLTSRLLLQ
ncbi:Uncharacterised protein [Vibrio cholerae]|nr:Uncharacterised protein [Vibrio cholerae]